MPEIENRTDADNESEQLSCVSVIDIDPMMNMDVSSMHSADVIRTVASCGDIPPVNMKDSKLGNQNAKSMICTKSKKNNLVYKDCRISMTFSNDKMRQIERENCILLSKIMHHRKITSIPRPANALPKNTNGTRNRVKTQRSIDEQNARLDRRIMNVKPVTGSWRKS